MLDHLSAKDRDRVPRYSNGKYEKHSDASCISFVMEQLLNGNKAMSDVQQLCLLIDTIVRVSLLFDQYQLINFLNSVKK